MASAAVSVCLPLGVDNKEESPARQGKGRWLRYSMAAALLVVVLVCSLAYRADGARSQAVAASRRAAGKARARQLSATGQAGKASDHSAKLLHDKTHTANKPEAAASGPKQHPSMAKGRGGRDRRARARAHSIKTATSLTADVVLTADTPATPNTTTTTTTNATTPAADSSVAPVANTSATAPPPPVVAVVVSSVSKEVVAPHEAGHNTNTTTIVATDTAHNSTATTVVPPSNTTSTATAAATAPAKEATTATTDAKPSATTSATTTTTATTSASPVGAKGVKGVEEEEVELSDDLDKAAEDIKGDDDVLKGEWDADMQDALGATAGMSGDEALKALEEALEKEMEKEEAHKHDDKADTATAPATAPVAVVAPPKEEGKKEQAAVGEKEAGKAAVGGDALHGVVAQAEAQVDSVKASSAANDFKAPPNEPKKQDTSTRDMSVWVLAGVLCTMVVLGVAFKVNQRRPRYHNLTNSTDGGYQPPAQWLNAGMEMRQHNNQARPSSYNDEYERFSRLTSGR